MSLSSYEQQIVDCVEQYGWFCVTVIDPSGVEPNFSYTVGFGATLNLPECIVFGLEPKIMRLMLAELFQQLRDGAELSPERRWQGLLQNCDCISRPVHEQWIVREYFNSAIWYRRAIQGKSDRLSAMQIYWPGAVGGLYPWESGAADVVRERQPLLYLAASEGNA